MIITRGAQMALFIATSLLIKAGEDVIVGEPGYFGANITFRQLGANLNRVPADENGIDVDAVESICRKKKIRLIYVIPHHHHPTTVTFTPERRMRLLALAEKYRFAIIEDDYDYDFHYASKPMMPMASLDRHGSVIYIGTLTKTLAPAFRIGFMTGPADFIRLAGNYRRFMDHQGDSLLENAVAALYQDGTISRHIKKSVRIYKDRRDHFCKLLTNELGNAVSFKVPDGGMAVWTTFKNEKLPQLSTAVLKKGLVLNNGLEYNTHKTNYNAARLGFASLNFDEQKTAIEIIKSELKS
jgi:GntR family transcriptional regulator / MocR family aminotransferase